MSTRAMVAEQASSDWIEWAGGDCPVLPSAFVEVRLRFATDAHLKPAGEFSWSITGSLGDIVAYRVVE